MGVYNQFPYTNFHEINLDWLIAEVKKISDGWIEYKNTMDAWKLTIDEELEVFNEWFDHLDVQDEVRNVINDMVASGQFQLIAQPTIRTTTEAWLTRHITQPTNPVIDSSLSISGAAADAAAAGALRSQLQDYNCYSAIPRKPDASGTENGVNYSVANGIITLTGTASTVFQMRFLYSQTDRKLYLANGQKYRVIFNPTGSANTARLQIAVYKENGTGSRIIYDAASSGEFTMPDDDTYVGILCRIVVNTGVTVNTRVPMPGVVTTASNAELVDLIGAMGKYNAENVCFITDQLESTFAGITYSVIDNVLTASGTSSGVWYYRIFYGPSSLPTWLVRGETYYVDLDKTGTMGAVKLQVALYRSDSTYTYIFNSSESGKFTFPTSTEWVGCQIRMMCDGSSVINGTMKVGILNAMSNAALTESIENMAKRVFPRNCVFFGASEIVGRLGTAIGSRQLTNYKLPDTISKMLGIRIANVSAGGLGYCHASDGGTYANAYDLISHTDITGYDTIFMIYGGNDGFQPVGEWNSTNESECLGQFNKIINYIYGENPNARVVVFAPMNGRNVGSFPKYWYGTSTSQTTSRQILSDHLKQACEYYNIPYIEQVGSPVNGFTIRNQMIMGADGVHLTEYGYERVGEWMAGQLGTILGV